MNRTRPTRTAVPLALVAAALVLTGTGGAVAGAMVTGAQIKDGTVTSADVRNRSLGVADLSVPAVRRLQPATVPSGTTVRGVWTASGEHPGNGDAIDVALSLPVPAPRTIRFNQVLIDDGAGAAACRGTEAVPTAPRGKVCVYGTRNETVSEIGQGGAFQGQNPSRYGFFIRVQGSGVYENVVATGTWAYTAP